MFYLEFSYILLKGSSILGNISVYSLWLNLKLHLNPINEQQNSWLDVVKTSVEAILLYLIEKGSDIIIVYSSKS